MNPTGAPGPARGRREAGGSNDRFMRKKKSRGRSTGIVVPSPAPKGNKRKIRIDNVISVGQLAHQMGLKAGVIIKQLMGLGVMATVNEMLDFDTAEMVAIEFEYEIENVGFQEHEVIGVAAHAVSDEGGDPCPPVVTIMGHVDHGKTTLLDAIRKTKVAAGEFGGITQHIGAYQVEANGSLITFIDTPGHAAFSDMRARGAAVTDIVILVVAVDDGVQAQTIEAINHSRAAGVPIIVAVNKMDKPDANPDSIKKRLTEFEVLSEEWGGETMFVPVSALAETGLDDLLDAINLQAEMLELKANADRPADGVVVEAQQVRGRGSVATVLVRGGTLNKGDYVVMGTTFGKVRQMVSHTGAKISSAGPSTPVEISGLSGVPEAGDAMSVVKTERDAKSIAQHRLDKKKQEILAATRRRTSADLFAAANEAGIKQLNIVLKADVRGSLEALKSALESIEVEGARVNVLHHGVGDISESDVSLVSANNGLLLGFNVRVDARARKSAESQSVAPERYTIIYDVIDRVKGVMRSLIGPIYEDVREGTAVVRQVFSVSKVGTIAGCHVQDGKIGRNFHIRLIRNNVQVWEGKLLTLKRFKDDVTEVTHGYECGVGLEGYNEIEEGDILEAFVRKEVVDNTAEA
jgi:translation initiation factor IF-2